MSSIETPKSKLPPDRQPPVPHSIKVINVIQKTRVFYDILTLTIELSFQKTNCGYYINIAELYFNVSIHHTCPTYSTYRGYIF